MKFFIPITALLFTLLPTAHAQNQEYVSVRRVANFFGLNAERDIQIVSKEANPVFISRYGTVQGVAKVKLRIPVCSSGRGDQAPDIEWGNFQNRTLAKMGGPIQVFEERDIKLSYTIQVPRGVAIADSCRQVPVDLEFVCGAPSPLRLDSIRSAFRGIAAVDGYTCRFNFPEHQTQTIDGPQTGFIDVTLTGSDIELFFAL